MKQNHAGNKLNFEIKFLPEFTEKYKNDNELLIKTFSLQSSISLKNMFYLVRMVK